MFAPSLLWQRIFRSAAACALPLRRFATVAVCALALTTSYTATADDHAGAKSKYKIAWSIYVGWMPWDYADSAGIVKKWADKYGIEIEVVQFNDYIESINQYTAGEFDGCTMTNMDALTIPAAGGVTSTGLIVGDFSNGNDGIVLKGSGQTLADLKGQSVNLVELSVSHYTLARALDSVGMTERDVKVVNTSDADIVAAFNTPDVTSVVTWNPLLAEVAGKPNVSKVFDSSMIPGEIIDMLVVNSDVLEKDPRLGKALAGAWYETMSIIKKRDAAGLAARRQMAAASGTDLAGFGAQMAATNMFFEPGPAMEFTQSSKIIETMNLVAGFSFEHGLLGEGAPDHGFIGMSFPGRIVLGSRSNVQLKFDDTYMKMAAQGEL